MRQPRKASQRRGRWIKPAMKWGLGLNHVTAKIKIRQDLTAIRAVMRVNRMAARELNGPGVCLHPNYKLKLGSNYSTASYQLHKLTEGLNLPVPQCPDLSNGHNGTRPIGLLLISNTLVHVKCGVSAFTVYRINTLVQ